MQSHPLLSRPEILSRQDAARRSLAQPIGIRRALVAPGVLDPSLHGEAHAKLPLAVHACFACMLRAKLYWGTTNPGFAETAEFATPPMRKPPF